MYLSLALINQSVSSKSKGKIKTKADALFWSNAATTLTIKNAAMEKSVFLRINNYKEINQFPNEMFLTIFPKDVSF